MTDISENHHAHTLFGAYTIYTTFTVKVVKGLDSAYLYYRRIGIMIELKLYTPDINSSAKSLPYTELNLLNIIAQSALSKV
jgi:hypothetical protein